jgi:hypothetical protein
VVSTTSLRTTNAQMWAVVPGLLEEAVGKTSP